MKKGGTTVRREREEVTGLYKMDRPSRVVSPQGLDDLDNMGPLSAEEKELAKSLMQRMISPKVEWGMGKGELPAQARLYTAHDLGCQLYDPEGYAPLFNYYDQLTTQVIGLDGNDEIMQASTHKAGVGATAKRDDPDIRRRYRNAMLCVAAVCVHNKNMMLLRMTVNSATEADPDETGSCQMSPEKVAMLPYPGSSVWSDEEALVLEFSYATMRHEMTDEIWDRAMDAWGYKQTARYIQWIGLYTWETMYIDALTRRKAW